MSSDPEEPRHPVRAALGLAAGVAIASGLAWQQASSGPPEVSAFFVEALVRVPTGSPLAWFWAHSAPWLHGDVAHLAGNVVGLLLLGGLVETRQGARPTLSVALAGALAGVWIHLFDGATTVGMSGGVYALAGALATGAGDQAQPWGRPRVSRVAAAGWAWLGLGLLGGIGQPLVDQGAHGIGALVGVACGRVWAVAPGVATLLPMLFLGLSLGPLSKSLVGGTQASQRTQVAEPLLRALPELRDLVTASVAWHQQRRTAVSAVLDAAKTNQPLDRPSPALRKVLAPPRALRVVAERVRERLSDLQRVPQGGEYRPRIEGLLPVDPPRGFEGEGALVVDEASKPAWEALLAHLRARDRAVQEGAEAMQAWRSRL